MADLLDTAQKYRLNTNEGENLFENHLIVLIYLLLYSHLLLHFFANLYQLFFQLLHL